MTARKQGMEAAHARIESAAEEMDRIDDNAALIRQAWESGNRDAVKNLLNSIIQEIDIRVDGIFIKVYALPGGKVYELEPMAAPVGIIRLPYDLKIARGRRASSRSTAS